MRYPPRPYYGGPELALTDDCRQGERRGRTYERPDGDASGNAGDGAGAHVAGYATASGQGGEHEGDALVGLGRECDGGG